MAENIDDRLKAEVELYNSLNLEGSTDPHTDDGTSIYYNNGHLRYLYRHGVFYIASRDKTEVLYRLNIIDFHEITTSPPTIDDLILDFTKIPDQLHAEDGNGIVRRTIEDQLIDNQFDPKKESWSNKPSNAYILGICETFD